VPEVVDDGKTGFIVDNTSAMIEAVGKLSKINRKDCRKHVEERFTLDHMINGYEKVLRSIVTPPKPKTDTKKIIRSLKLLSDKLLINSPK
jgi:hypothetical protein